VKKPPPAAIDDEQHMARSTRAIYGKGIFFFSSYYKYEVSIQDKPGIQRDGCEKEEEEDERSKDPQDPSLHSAEPKESDFKQAPRCAQDPPQKPEDPA